MMIAITCEACGKELKAKDGLSGKRVRCPACKQPVLVPTVVPIEVPQRARHPTPEPPNPDPEQAPSSGWSFLVWLVVVAVLVTGIIGFNVLYATQNPNRTTMAGCYWGYLFIALGLHWGCGVVFYWDWFLSVSQECRFVEGFLGRPATRAFYGAVGLSLILYGDLVAMSIAPSLISFP